MSNKARKQGEEHAYAGATREDAEERCQFTSLYQRESYIDGFVSMSNALLEMHKNEMEKEDEIGDLFDYSLSSLHSENFTVGQMADIKETFVNLIKHLKENS